LVKIVFIILALVLNIGFVFIGFIIFYHGNGFRSCGCFLFFYGRNGRAGRADNIKI